MDDFGDRIKKLGCLGFACIVAVLGFAIGAAFLGIVVFVGIVEFTNPGGEDTKPIPDTEDKIVLPEFDKQLDPLRADWDIYGRFEQWPAVLPLARMSEAAYLDDNSVERQFKQTGLSSFRKIDSPFHTQVAYVGSAENVAVVVFRGTDDTEDWFVNANMYLHELPIGEIHTGFSGAYGMLQSEINDELERLNPKHLWITGHSLGGAMALTCAVDMVVYQKREIDGVITFGQPKIGKESLTKYLQDQIGDRYVHFANERDAVPFLPNTFSHCGLLLRFFKGKVQKSSGYFRFGSVGSTPFTQEIEYEAIDELPPIEPQLYEQFKQTYRGEKDARLMMEGPFGAIPGATTPPTTKGAVPWKEDHSMTLYVEKIQASIDKATSPNQSRFQRQETGKEMPVP